ncbi:hypothetical protein GCM10011380_04230 [Sphingomonas metalli]|uniref:DUF4235 domain-containing protein n=1 Tax=Sphingomonas metalli TaxID=1779358 RepID=A0A916SU66_9SPHN|nr:hypothetical protein [Sphingomonas metalli]GGB17853.1 hypothetical protein GCM10011380_04230 [Sphingomonas metalli]
MTQTTVAVQTLARRSATAEENGAPPLLAIAAATILVGAVLRRPAVMRSGARMLASQLVATGARAALAKAASSPSPAVATDAPPAVRVAENGKRQIIGLAAGWAIGWASERIAVAAVRVGEREITRLLARRR